MRRYIEHIRETRAPHERRGHAVQVSGIITAAIFAVWVGTLGLRLASSEDMAQAPDSSLSAAAAAAQGASGPHLEVATTSTYGN